VHGAVVEALEAGVEAGADLDHGACGMVAEKIPDPQVEEGGPQSGRRDPPPLVEPLEVPIDGIDHLDGLAIIENGTLPARVDGAGVERNQQGFLYRAELDGLFGCHGVLIMKSDPV
jgi:hypothetical protein